MVGTIEITYCTEWNYLPLASSLAAAIKDKYNVKVELVEGHGGILKVTMGDTVIYDNSSRCGRLPTIDEILKIVETAKQ